MNRKKMKKGKIAVITVCVILAALFASVFFISGVFEKQTYLEPWDRQYFQKSGDPRVQLAAHGLLAANGHNMQPWKIRLDPADSNAFYLYADSGRLTKEVDPFARQMMITQGTFLEYVAQAGGQLGYKTAISLFPNGGYDENNLVQSMDTLPVAKVTIEKTQPGNGPLYPYMFAPDTNRAPYQAGPLDAGELGALQSTALEEGVSLQVFDQKKDTDELGKIAMQAATIEGGVDRVMQETNDIFRPNEYEKNKYRYGFSVEGQGTTGIMAHIMQGLVTVFPSLNSGKGASDQFIQSTQKSIDNTPAYAMIKTSDNSRKSQVLSGMVYSRLVLTGQSAGIAMQPLSQVLEEYREMEGPYTQIHSEYAQGGETIQMLFRMGKPTQDVAQTMRRDVGDLVVQ